MKRLLILLLVLVNLSAAGQTLTGDRVVARQGLYLRDWWVDSVKRDTANWRFSPRTVPTSKAIYDFVQGRGVGGGNYAPTLTTQATSTTLTPAYETWVYTGSTPAIFTLPALSGGTGSRYVVKNKGSDTLTLAPFGTDKIYTFKDTSSLKVAPGHAYTVQNDGASWDVTAAYFHNALVTGTAVQSEPAPNTTPAAPTVTGDDAANTLIASHSLGASEIVMSENNAAFTAYSGTISVGDVARAEGYWKFKTKAATGRNESPVALSPAFTVAGGGGTTAAAEVSQYKTRLAAAGYTMSATQEGNWTAFVQSLMDAGVYSKIDVIQPLYIGSTQTQRLLSFKSAAQNLQSFEGSPVMAATGVTFNAASYAVTSFNPSTMLSDPLSTHIGAYVQGIADGGGIDIGVTDNYTTRYALAANFSGSAYYQSGVSETAAGAPPVAAGFFLGTRTAANVSTLYNNGTEINTNTSSEAGGLPNGLVYFGAWNLLSSGTNGPANASARTISLVTMGRGLTSSEAAALNTAIQTLAQAEGFKVP